VGAGLDFLGALNKAVMLKTFRKSREPLLDELSVVLQEIKLGRRRFEALKDMAKRVNLPELSSFVRTLVLADRMGTPISEVLTMHAEDVRFERYQRAERMALKAPIKILVPLIFCIMPVVAIVVAGPVLLQFIRMNPFKGM
jgi:tight adherence protein C